MSIFDESSVEASHSRLASSVYVHVEALVAATDIMNKSLHRVANNATSAERDADRLAASVLGYRVVNDVGAATKLIDCGYFTQGSAIFRDIAEVGMLALLFSRTPEKMREWRTAGQNRHGKFGRTSIKKNLENDSHFSFFSEYFDVFSQFGTHPSAESIYFHVEENTFHSGPHYNEKLYIRLYRDLAVLVCNATHVCGHAYKAIFDLDAEVFLPNENERFIAAWEQIRDAQN